MVNIALKAYAKAESSLKINVNRTANNAPMTVAGSLRYPFFKEALAVGSIVTIAVNIAKIGFKSKAKQKRAVKNVAKPVLIVRAPIRPLYQLLLIKKLLVM